METITERRPDGLTNEQLEVIIASLIRTEASHQRISPRQLLATARPVIKDRHVRLLMRALATIELQDALARIDAEGDH